jgi:hypothetical protein
MFKLRIIRCVLLGAIGALCISEACSAELLKGQEREEFIAGAIKGCMGTYGKDEGVKMTKPQYKQYCACTATGIADHISKDDLIRESEKPDYSDEFKAITERESTRCLPKDVVRQVFVGYAKNECLRTHGDGTTGLIAKPIFEKYCVCMAKGLVDRVSPDDVLKQDTHAGLSKEMEAIVDQEATRCFPTEVGREFYVATLMKTCVGKYDYFKKDATLTKPRFDNFCGCLANSTADRIPLDELIKGNDSSELGKKNEAIIGEEVTRCLAVPKEPTQQKKTGRK